MTNAAIPVPHEAEGSFVSLMRHRNYALLWFGQLISQTGDRFHWVAISLWVYAQTGSSLSVSYAILALLVGPAVVGVFAGALVDRLDRRKILIYADLLRAVLVFLIPDLMQRGLVWVYIDLFLISAASAFFRPAVFAMIPQSVPKGQLLRANAFFATMDTSTEIFGPALAGLVVTLQGYAAAIYFDALTYLASAVFMSALRTGEGDSSAPPADSDRATIGTRDAIREGLRYIWSDRIQRGLLAFLVGGYWVAGLNSLQTPMAKSVIGATDSQFGWFQSAGGIGFITASLLLGWFGVGIPKGRTVAFSYLLWALGAGMMGLSANYTMLLVTAFWVGFANMLLFVNVGTIMMEHTPPKMIGRAITARQMVVAVMRALALLFFGWLADAVGVRESIASMAVVSLVGTLAVIAVFREVVGYDAAPTAGKQIELVRNWRARLFGSLAESLAATADPMFVGHEQQAMSGLTIIIVCCSWLVMLFILPFEAMAVLATIAITVPIASLLRSLARRILGSAWIGRRVNSDG